MFECGFLWERKTNAHVAAGVAVHLTMILDAVVSSAVDNARAAP